MQFSSGEYVGVPLYPSMYLCIKFPRDDCASKKCCLPRFEKVSAAVQSGGGKLQHGLKFSDRKFAFAIWKLAPKKKEKRRKKHVRHSSCYARSLDYLDR